MMKHCPFCGAKIEDSARFCLYCMSSLDEKQVWQTPRRHIRRWQACLAALCAFALSMEVVHLSLNKLPVSAPIGSAESSAPEHSTSSSDEPYTGTTSIVTNPVTTSIVTNPITTSIITGNNTTSIVTNLVTTSIVTNRVTTSIVTEAATTKTSESTASRSSNTTTKRGTTITPTISTTPTSTSTSTSTKTTTTTKTAMTTTTVTNPGEFVPDYRPGYANTVGNTTYNIFNNDGLITKQDEWLYYSANYALRKVRTDGTEQQIITKIKHETVYQLNIIGDYLYYRIYHDGIYRVRTDGSDTKLIVDDKTLQFGGEGIEQLYVTENYGYFSNASNVFRFDLKTYETKRINGHIARRGICYLSEKDDILIGYTNRKGGVISELCKYKLSSPDSPQWELGEDEYFGIPHNCIVIGDTMFFKRAFNGVTNIYRANWRSSSAPTAEMFYNYQDQGFSYCALHCYSPYKGGVLAAMARKSTADHLQGTYFIFMDGTTSFIEGTETDTTYFYDVISPYNFGDDYVYYLKDDQLYRANGDCSNPVQLTK